LLKGIEPFVSTSKIKGAMYRNTTEIKSRNLSLRSKWCQKAVKKIEVHPIYKTQVLLHRRITGGLPCNAQIARSMDTAKTTGAFGQRSPQF